MGILENLVLRWITVLACLIAKSLPRPRIICIIMFVFLFQRKVIKGKPEGCFHKLHNFV